MKDALTIPLGCAALVAVLAWITPYAPLYLAAALCGGLFVLSLIAIGVAIFAGR